MSLPLHDIRNATVESFPESASGGDACDAGFVPGCLDVEALEVDG